MKVNIKTLSQLTGFSPATVSNALNNKKGVNKETAEKILSAARETGYLSENRINSIKLIIYRASGTIVNDSPFFSYLIEGVEEEARNFDYDTLVCNLSRQAPDFSDRVAGLCNDASSALLILATELEREDALRFQSALSPVVMLDNWYEDLDFNSVLIDNTDAACNAVRYLIGKGHRKIGYLQGSYRIKNFYYRQSGYKRTLFENGLEVSPEYTFSLTPSMEGAHRDMLQALQDNPPLPTAFFADNDMIALGAIRALQQCGYRVPEDISIVGFDDLPFCAISDPPLTTVRVQNFQMGQAAVRRLIELAEYGSGYCTKVQIRSHFIERGSVRDLNVN